MPPSPALSAAAPVWGGMGWGDINIHIHININIDMNIINNIKLGGKSMHLVAHSPNSSNENRHPVLKSDNVCSGSVCQQLAIYCVCLVYLVW